MLGEIWRFVGKWEEVPWAFVGVVLGRFRGGDFVLCFVATGK